jgi:uncharacterized protein (DUF2249 family)
MVSTVHEIPGHGAARSAVPAAGGRPLTLAEEHALLLKQVAVRAGDVLTAIDGGRWPARELQALVGYLRAEVLRQAADQEWLFPAHQPGEDFARLVREHVRLRAATEVLEQAASGEGRSSLTQLTAATRDLLTQLERHLAAEEQVLAAAGRPGTAPGVSPAGRRHEWYPLTEGPVVDLDALPSGQVADAAVDRLLRLRSGEQVELQSSRDPWPVWQRMNDLYPGRYGFAYTEEGPERWRVQVTCRDAV